jgi:hypothetical protein
MFCMHVPSLFYLPLILVSILIIHDWVWGIESDVSGGGVRISFHLHVVGPI